jgi:hypothetical protein
VTEAFVVGLEQKWEINSKPLLNLGGWEAIDTE